MKAHKMTIILALLFVFGLLAVDSVVAGSIDTYAAPLIKVGTGYPEESLLNFLTTVQESL
jgi:hypothetical protein